MIHVYNGSKWTEKKFDSVEQLVAKLGVDSIYEEDKFVKAFNHGKNLYVFVDTDTNEETEETTTELRWFESKESAEDTFWTIREEI